MTTGALSEAKLQERATRDPEFRQKLLSDPNAAIADELGVDIPGNVKVTVLEEQPGEAILVLPPVWGSGEVGDEQLEAVSGGDSVWVAGCGSGGGDGSVNWRTKGVVT
jgi:hypothetical protein